MKKIILLGIVLLTAVPVFTQVEEVNRQELKDDDFKTVLGGNSVGGYGSVSVSYSVIDEKNAVVFGARGGVILGHSFAMGFGGAGFINEYHYDPVEDINVSLAGGYGGVFFEPIIAPKFPVHISIPVLLGVGGVSYTTLDDTYNDYEFWVEDSEAFLVAEPGIEIEFNITHFFRFSPSLERLTRKIYS